ncbi:hypothetical protein COL30_27650 [Bacillus pseudomycoides]|uniref:hypothetical protein n=1 Tax=Bacillus pseudomycoides TaxID=64104 RepID=UPI000BED2E01|nr:hypothetical protein [Bacillus pseudomycoides]PEA80859.1 hypothetical protein CON99_25825 [Bacillus pseudomycoides]PEK21079.1 hypothetical protein CN693_15595 [Bacillus pseudomycoides]PEO06055.1 hypothetical protein CN542_27910 [Bacillus pseudomycoides]PEP59524.1 hypothetical protein CN591_21590 [Bacillus pseudomycoides]PFW63914.1 hypothetical protein COL25_27290 [Bacillus pseudomycoides]
MSFILKTNQLTKSFEGREVVSGVNMHVKKRFGRLLADILKLLHQNLNYHTCFLPSHIGG